MHAGLKLGKVSREKGRRRAREEVPEGRRRSKASRDETCDGPQFQKGGSASPRAGGVFKQESEQKRERGVAAVASRAIVPAFGVVQVWVEVRAREAERQGDAGS